MNTRNKGNLAENTACEYLTTNKFKIIKRNFYFKGGEIDIIAFKENTLHFIEVKSGNTFEPVYNITNIKLKRIIKGAYIYMRQNKFTSTPFCIDAIIIKGTHIEYLHNLTLI